MSDDRLEADSIFGTNSVDEIILSNDASMSTAILVDQAKRIADATVNDILEMIENRKVTLGNLLHALLDYASRDVLPNNCSGLRYTAGVICGAHNENRLTPVARVWLEGMLLPVKLARTSITKYPTPSDDQTPPDLSETALMVQPSSRTHNFRDKLLIRQEYRCAVDRNLVDRECEEDGWTTCKKDDHAYTKLRASHIIPFSLSQLFEANERESEKPAVTWALLKHWTSNNTKQLIVDGIDNPSNGLLLDPNFHEAFGAFYLYFLPVTDQPNTYTAHIFGSTCSFPLVTFHPRGGVAVPSPKLLAVHAALAGVLYASRFGIYFSMIWDDHEMLAAMAGDGSTDIRALTYSLQNLTSQ